MSELLTHPEILTALRYGSPNGAALTTETPELILIGECECGERFYEESGKPYYRFGDNIMCEDCFDEFIEANFFRKA